MENIEKLENWFNIDNLREVVDLDLESLKGWKVKFYKELLVAEDEKLAQSFSDWKFTKLQLFTEMLSMLIIDWNFTNKDGVKYEVKAENIRLLPTSFTKEMVLQITWKTLDELQNVNDYSKLKKKELES